MESTDLRDKIALDPLDSPAMVEFFSRKEPGDEITGTFKATLDENGDKVILLSIVEVSLDQGAGEPPIVSKTEADEEEAEKKTDSETEADAVAQPKSAAMEVMGGQTEGE